jgi:hypothetical protein
MFLWQCHRGERCDLVLGWHSVPPYRVFVRFWGICFEFFEKKIKKAAFFAAF